MLPPHGRMTCRECFSSGSTGDTATPHCLWQMKNDPGAWGGNDPRFLVLGFSKGSTQSDIFERGHFDEVAFAGMRSRLEGILRHFGILNGQASIDDAIADPASHIGFGSLVRCSVTRLNEKTGKQECSGNLIVKAFTEIPEIIDTCARRHLVDLPSSVRAVLLLGSNTQYIKQVQNVLRHLFGDTYQQINEVAADADGRRWVHVAHPSRANGHFMSWLKDDGEGGHKRRLAEESLHGICMAPIDRSRPPQPFNKKENPSLKTTTETTVAQPGPASETKKAQEAESILKQAIKPTAAPTKYIAGFRTERGRELALERNRNTAIYLWAEIQNPDIKGIKVMNQANPGMPYSANQPRNSNLNNKNAPRLKEGKEVYYLKIDDAAVLRAFVDWYRKS